MEIKLTVVKAVAHWAVAAGSAAIIKDVIKNNVDEPNGRINRVKYTAGAFAMGGLVAAKSAEFMDEKIDSWVAAFNRVSKDVEEVVQEAKQEQKEEDHFHEYIQNDVDETLSVYPPVDEND